MNALQQNHRILKDMTSIYLSPSIKLIELYNFTHYLGEITQGRAAEILNLHRLEFRDLYLNEQPARQSDDH